MGFRGAPSRRPHLLSAVALTLAVLAAGAFAPAAAQSSLPPATTNQAPQASLAVPSLAVVGQQVMLDASGSSDPDGSVVQYEWDFDGDGTYDQTTGDPTVNHAFTGPPRQATVGLRVTDNSGATATTTATLIVGLPPVAGTLSASPPNAVPLNTPITFIDTGASDPNPGGSITKYEWDLDGNGTFETDTGTTPSATHSYGSNGARTVTVRVTGATGLTAVATYALVAANQPPTIGQLSVDPNPVAVGQPVTFTVSASDPEGHGIARYDWDLDGNGGYETPSGSSPTVGYVYPNAGPIPVGVRVTDTDGGQSTAIVTLQVNPGPNGEGIGATNSGGSAGGDGGGGTSGGSAPGVRALRAGLVGSVIQRARTVRSLGLAVACRADRDARCALTVAVSARDARRYGLRSRRRNIVLGSAGGYAAAGRDARLSVLLSAAGRRLVGRARTLSLLVRGVIDDRQGGRVMVTRVVIVKP